MDFGGGIEKVIGSTLRLDLFLIGAKYLHGMGRGGVVWIPFVLDEVCHGGFHGVDFVSGGEVGDVEEAVLVEEAALRGGEGRAGRGGVW
mmetsp:Transcript_30304/g.61841  ORF Transcript_30304/g.61841 Transcript_30304/m.61841 type:complete len:89 (-) Transcript_30304:121-387(-)